MKSTIKIVSQKPLKEVDQFISILSELGVPNNIYLSVSAKKDDIMLYTYDLEFDNINLINKINNIIKVLKIPKFDLLEELKGEKELKDNGDD